MLLDDENITARAVVRRGVFKHASDLTRRPERRALLEKYRARQADLRAIAQKTDKQSKSRLSARIAKQEERIRELEGQRDLLIASHRAMILAVAEMGGMPAWRRFFHEYQDAVDNLKKLQALASFAEDQDVSGCQSQKP